MMKQNDIQPERCKDIGNCSCGFMMKWDDKQRSDVKTSGTAVVIYDEVDLCDGCYIQEGGVCGVADFFCQVVQAMETGVIGWRSRAFQCGTHYFFIQTPWR